MLASARPAHDQRLRLRLRFHFNQLQPLRVTETASTPKGPLEAPSFSEVRNYTRNIQQRETLGAFVKAGWSPAELAEYARSIYLAPGRTYPAASSYQAALDFGPENTIAKIILAQLRAPNYVMPPFNRPLPPRPIPRDDPDHPEHTQAVREEVQVIAQCLQKRRAEREGLPLPDPDKPIQRSLWKHCFQFRQRYGSLERTLLLQELRNYR